MSKPDMKSFSPDAGVPTPDAMPKLDMKLFPDSISTPDAMPAPDAKPDSAPSIGACASVQQVKTWNLSRADGIQIWGNPDMPNASFMVSKRMYKQNGTGWIPDESYRFASVFDSAGQAGAGNKLLNSAGGVWFGIAQDTGFKIMTWDEVQYGTYFVHALDNMGMYQGMGYLQNTWNVVTWVGIPRAAAHTPQGSLVAISAVDNKNLPYTVVYQMDKKGQVPAMSYSSWVPGYFDDCYYTFAMNANKQWVAVASTGKNLNTGKWHASLTISDAKSTHFLKIPETEYADGACYMYNTWVEKIFALKDGRFGLLYKDNSLTYPWHSFVYAYQTATGKWQMGKSMKVAGEVTDMVALDSGFLASTLDLQTGAKVGLAWIEANEGDSVTKTMKSVAVGACSQGSGTPCNWDPQIAKAGRSIGVVWSVGKPEYYGHAAFYKCLP
ncbi:MAG: hypothetical protein ABH832_02535 [bacterium]